LRQPRRRALGPGERSAPLSLQSLFAHIQRSDKYAIGEFARMKDKWAAQTEAMIEGVSIAKAAKRCDVHYTTAFRWRHRFLASLAGDKPKALAGIVEGDETFVLESFKGKRSGMPRKSRKRDGKSAKRGLSAEQIPVLVARDRRAKDLHVAHRIKRETGRNAVPQHRQQFARRILRLDSIHKIEV
jgi:hypothetical protein